MAHWVNQQAFCNNVLKIFRKLKGTDLYKPKQTQKSEVSLL